MGTTVAPVGAEAGPTFEPRSCWIEGICREHGSAIHALAARLCGVDRADDVTQEVLAHLWSRPDRYDPGRGPMRAYLLTMCRGKAVDRIRADAARDKRESIKDHTGIAQEAVETALIRQDAAAVLRGCLGRLPQAERDAIEASFFGGRSYKETAVALGVPEGTVKTRIRRGLTRLRADAALEGATALLG